MRSVWLNVPSAYIHTTHPLPSHDFCPSVSLSCVDIFTTIKFFMFSLPVMDCSHVNKMETNCKENGFRLLSSAVTMVKIPGVCSAYCYSLKLNDFYYIRCIH